MQSATAPLACVGWLDDRLGRAGLRLVIPVILTPGLALLPFLDRERERDAAGYGSRSGRP